MDPLQRFETTCPECKVLLKVRNKARGTKRICPNCKASVLIPGVFIPDPDVDAIRILHLLAVQATVVMQRAFDDDRDLAILLNTIFVKLPHESDLESLGLQLGLEANRVFRICKEANTVLQRFGHMHHNVWLDSLAQMQIIEDGRSTCVVSIAQSRRKWSIEVRRRIWMRFNRQCHYCGNDLPTWQGAYMHLDHRIPLYENGADDEHNLVPACPPCNLEKGKRYYPELM